jgi:hypothetical protein
MVAEVGRIARRMIRDAVPASSYLQLETVLLARRRFAAPFTLSGIRKIASIATALARPNVATRLEEPTSKSAPVK